MEAKLQAGFETASEAVAPLLMLQGPKRLPPFWPSNQDWEVVYGELAGESSAPWFGLTAELVPVTRMRLTPSPSGTAGMVQLAALGMVPVRPLSWLVQRSTPVSRLAVPFRAALVTALETVTAGAGLVMASCGCSGFTQPLTGALQSWVLLLSQRLEPSWNT